MWQQRWFATDSVNLYLIKAPSDNLAMRDDYMMAERMTESVAVIVWCIRISMFSEKLHDS